MKKAFALVLALALMLSFTACKGDKDGTSKDSANYAPIQWEYLTELPESFPKLCDYVTTANEKYTEDESLCAMYWAVLDQKTFDGYKATVEKWAGAKFGTPAQDGTVSLSTTVNGKKITVNAAYNGNATGNYLQNGNYDSQAKIEVISAN